MNAFKKKLIILLLILNCQYILSYNLTNLNLGIANFLDGGPIRPYPGFYLFQYFNIYTSDKFYDFQGKRINDPLHPKFNMVRAIFELVYQFDRKIIFGGTPGIVALMPMVMHSRLTKNALNIKDSGSGFGDLSLGAYLQFDTLERNGRPFYIHRFKLGAFFPTGKSEEPEKIVNPGSNVYLVEPSWSATLFFTEKLNASWQLDYVWTSENKKTKIQSGQGVYLDFSLAYQANKEFLFGINGYYFEEFQNSKLCGKEIPNSRQRVVGLGPGAAYFVTNESQKHDHTDLIFFTHLYFETAVRNRPGGIKFILRFVRHF